MQWRTSKNLVDYNEALSQMEARVVEIIQEKSEELVWLLEHPSLYTAGTSATEKDLLSNALPVFYTGRGGKFTYHGPGQRVVYIMLNLKKRAVNSAPDVRQYVYNLEQVIIETLLELNISSRREAGRIGIWVGEGEVQKKIAAIGVRIRKWVTYHGLAININPDLNHYQSIVPCGISEYGVTSLEEIGVNCNLEMFDSIFKQKFNKVFE
jgi:lipoyl(octanoyl) transferase